MSRPLGGLASVLAGVATAVLMAALATSGATGAVRGDNARQSDEKRFFAGLPYTGEFASPQILVTKGRYFAVATNEDGNNLPVMHSNDLRTWIPRAPLPEYYRYRSWAGFNDAMPQPAAWAATRYIDGANRYGIWAPAIAKMSGQYVAAYAAMVSGDEGRRCISLAYADYPEGPYTDVSKAPIVCSTETRGSIDPDLIRVGKRNYLIWKNSGVKGSVRTQVWVRQLNADATAFKTGSQPRPLLVTGREWEGNVIEAPDMIRYDGRFYLFYSGNSYTSAEYATGYAICRHVTGPCRRPVGKPLLATNTTVVGPGGAAPFRSLDGRLRLAYHAWSAPEVGATAAPLCSTCPPRRMHIATLVAKPNGLLKVKRLRLP